jgi:hypothetical protein
MTHGLVEICEMKWLGMTTGDDIDVGTSTGVLIVTVTFGDEIQFQYPWVVGTLAHAHPVGGTTIVWIKSAGTVLGTWLDSIATTPVVMVTQWVDGTVVGRTETGTATTECQVDGTETVGGT